MFLNLFTVVLIYKYSLTYFKLHLSTLKNLFKINFNTAKFSKSCQTAKKIKVSRTIISLTVLKNH